MTKFEDEAWERAQAVVEKTLMGCNATKEHAGIETGCCIACHEDNDQGYADLMDGELVDGFTYNYCCCAVVETLRKAGKLKQRAW